MSRKPVSPVQRVAIAIVVASAGLVLLGTALAADEAFDRIARKKITTEECNDPSKWP